MGYIEATAKQLIEELKAEEIKEAKRNIEYHKKHIRALEIYIEDIELAKSNLDINKASSILEASKPSKIRKHRYYTR